MRINNKNKDFWNIVKGIGILSVVIGHTTPFLIPYVYLYHLVIFFFVSGYLYSEEKYGDSPFDNVIARIKANWPKYFIFSTIFVLLHNLFLKYGWIINTTKYKAMDLAVQIVSSSVFSCSEVFADALWFVPVLILASSFFGGIIYFGRKLENTFHRNYLKHFFIILAGIAFAIVGVKMHQQNVILIYHIQTVIIVIPIFILAYYVRKIKDLNLYLKWYIFIPSILFLYESVNYFGWSISLADNTVPGFNFFLISLIGIYACLYLAKIILHLKHSQKYFLTIGKYSFEIMALHFFVIKFIDVFCAFITHETSPIVYGVFPYAYEGLWPFYIFFGTLCPCFIMMFVNKLGSYFKNLFSKKISNA